MSYAHFFQKDFSSQFIHSLATVSKETAEAAPPCLAVITSGGDAPGMNPSVRAIVRGALNQGYRVYAVRDGYLGLCRGTDQDITEINWVDVAGIIHIGGTFLGTARSEEFRTLEGRKKVVRNLLTRGINRLIIVGGDGSLTGAQKLHDNWAPFTDEILGEMSTEEKENPASWFHKHWRGRENDIHNLHIVGLVGSIDNDMGNTSMTIGCDSALNRICSAVDILSSTAASHQRVFVVEVMGRKCGWLALKAAVACGADWVFIPENPASLDWPQKISEKIIRELQSNKRSLIVIVAEGAQDVEMNPISAERVCKVLQEAGAQARLTILGHVQRGGAPSFYDRAHSMLLGHAAVMEMVKGTAKKEPRMICIEGLFDACSRPLANCLKACQDITSSIEEKKFHRAMELRGAGFVRAQEVMWALSRTKPFISSETKHNIGLLHVGACSPGMNTVVRAFVTLSELSGFATYGIRSGLTGLQNGDFYEMTANDVVTWSSLGGAKLGTSRYSPSEMNIGLIALQLQKHEIQTLVMMGGWDGYICMMQLKKKAHKYPYLQKVNIMIIPCTISNNLPCTDYSIGADTALNSIVSAVDKIKESAIAQRRVFVIEVMGAYCGFLCSMGAFATGAEKAYVPEEPPTLESLQKDLQDVKDSFENNKTMAIFFTTEKTSKVFDTKFLSKLFRIDSNDQFDVRVSILGHLQQGGSPSPMDRFLGVELVGETMKHISAYVEENKEGLFHVVGFTNGEVSFSDKDQILEQQDMKYRRPKNSWWTRTFQEISSQYAEWREKPEVYKSSEVPQEDE